MARLEYRRIDSPSGRETPTLVFLHHGLGSVSTWRDFPDRVVELSGLPAVIYSRYGYGQSAPAPPATRGPDFMHREALDVLPEVLSALAIEQPILVGHSDGASIAIIYAASELEPRPCGLALIAPHVIVEDRTVAGAAAARADFEAGTLRARLARHHLDPDGAFRAWDLTWQSAAFRSWNIEDEVSRVCCPMTIVQGLDDEYGTIDQVERIKRRAMTPPEVLLFSGCGHSPQQDRPDDTLAAIVRLTGMARCR
ncbi:MAG: alpha/beta hydrolase [Vicinamibacterales bacterium]